MSHDAIPKDDNGPRFTVAHERPGGQPDQNMVFIYDDEFHWDGTLKVTGDFETLADKMRYAQAICDALNAAEIPRE